MSPSQSPAATGKVSVSVMAASYRDTYLRLFREELARSRPGQWDESALPSYVHPNPLMRWLFWKRIDTALSLVPGLRDRAVLDVGCGGGVTFKWLHEAGSRITGCDSASGHLAANFATALGVPARIVTSLDQLAGGLFDCILALDVLEHVQDPGAMLERLRNLLTRGGRLILSGPTESLAYRAGRRLAGFRGHYHVHDVYSIERSLESSGFTRRSLRRLYPPLTLFRVSAWEPR